MLEAHIQILAQVESFSNHLCKEIIIFHRFAAAFNLSCIYIKQ